jgi:hypothetical protein
MDRESVEDGFLINPSVGNITFEWSISNKTLRIYHDNFSYNTTYTVSIPSTALSVDGFAFPEGYGEELTFSFTTKPQPVYPGNGGNGQEGVSGEIILLLEIIIFVGLLAIAIGITVTMVRRHNRKLFLAEMRRLASQKVDIKPRLMAKPAAPGQKMVYSYYEFLGVYRDATEKEIKRAYRKMSKMFHPDKYGKYLTEEELKGLKKSQIKLNHAKACLLNPRNRVLYDIHIGHKKKGEVEVPPEEKADEFDHEYMDDFEDDDWDIDIELDSDDYVDEIPELEVMEDEVQIPDVSTEELPDLEDLPPLEGDEPEGVDPTKAMEGDVGYSLPDDVEQ